MQSIAMKMTVVFAFKSDFAQSVRRKKVRQHQNLRFLRTRSRGRFGMCCSSTAINSKGSPSSKTCSGISTSNCKKKKTKVGRQLLSLPDFFEKEFDAVVNSYSTIFKPKETRGVLGAQSSEDVAACAVSRYIENKLNPSSFDCDRYNEFNCANNEDIRFESKEARCEMISLTREICDDKNLCTIDKWNEARNKCIYTPVDCTRFSKYHKCDPKDGECKEVIKFIDTAKPTRKPSAKPTHKPTAVRKS
jgi:hypothetical protein